MRMAALSEACGLPVATVKYYLREGLVPRGRNMGPNQADYDEVHLRRLRLIRALTDIGGLPLATVRMILEAMADDDQDLHDVLGAAHHALALRAGGAEPDSTGARETAAEIRAFLDARGWEVKAEAPAIFELANTLSTLRRLGWDVDAEVFTPYADAVDHLAAWELSHTDGAGPREQSVEGAVVGTVVFESALVALRRLAEEHHSARRFRATD